MYVPEHFSLPAGKNPLDLVRRQSFGILTTHGPEGLVATHLPFLVDEIDTEECLLGHFARANLHWQIAAEQESLIVFPGAHCYISPNWYVTPGNVPTWNYSAVHVYGWVELLDDNDTKHNIVQELSDKYERYLPDPWIPDYADAMLDAIVGFRFRIGRIEAKQKLSQNKKKEDRENAIQVLRGIQRDNEQEIADAMARSLEEGALD